MYSLHILHQHKLNVPTICVGNITAGGTGKTPCVIYIANFFKERGHNPGIIVSGYGRKNKTKECLIVDDNSAALDVSDEAILIKKKTKLNVIVGRNRLNASKILVSKFNADILIYDDGLQYKKIDFFYKILMVDDKIKFGNGFVLPAGPLRQTTAIMDKANLLIIKDFANSQKYWRSKYNNGILKLKLEPVALRLVMNDELYLPLEGEVKLNCDLNYHAFAAISNPKGFFDSLSACGIKFTTHVFPDHYLYVEKDFNFLQSNDIVIMTEKDAVKCKAFHDSRMLYLETKTTLQEF